MALVQPSRQKMDSTVQALWPHFQDNPEWLKAIVRSSYDAIIGKSLRGTIVSWNQAATAIYGYEAEEIIGKTIAELMPADKKEELPRFLEQIKNGDRIDHYETVRLRKDGSLN